MANSSNKDHTMEYDKQSYKKSEKNKNHLAGRLNKFEESITRSKSPTRPPIQLIQNQVELPQNVLNEVKHVHQLIKDNGQQGDYAIQISFGELITIYGNDKVGKLVEILSIGREHGYINYNVDDILQQDRDEDIFIKLIKTPY